MAPKAGRDHETPLGSVSDGEMDGARREKLWQTVSVTSGRIIIGWRVGT
jgi:hypothetical protein